MGMLDGKVAAVTGGGNGIGREVAKELAAQGAKVVVNDYGVTVDGRKEEANPADVVAQAIRATGGVAVANQMDIGTVKGGQGLVDQAISEFGKLDILVNVAGILRDKMIFNMSEEEWDEVIRVHLKGHYCTIRPASAHMRERKAGRIINFSSGAALGAPGQPNYGAAKAAIIGLTYSSALALAKYNVTVNAIMPGASTRMTDSIPQGRIPGMSFPNSHEAAGTIHDPRHVAPVVAFLASDEAQYISGQCIGANGYRVTLYSHIKPERVLMGDKAWTTERLASVFKGTLGGDLKLPRML